MDKSEMRVLLLKNIIAYQELGKKYMDLRSKYRFAVVVAWICAAITMFTALTSCTWGYEDEQSLESLYCFNQAFACCDGDQTCENETYDNCCMYRNCEDGLITEEELEESKTCRS